MLICSFICEGKRTLSDKSKNQQIGVELEDKRVQENRYDAEGLRFEMKENEKLLRFAYHKGELYFESGESSQTSYHLGAGMEGFTRNRKTSYLHQDEQLSTARLRTREEWFKTIICMGLLVRSGRV